MRQSLYTHAHCINSNYKAIAAADTLREIHPDIVCTSILNDLRISINKQHCFFIFM